VYVAPTGQLEVAIAPGREKYAPGETAALTVRTTSGGQQTRAAVGLFGVDETLGELAPLAGPDELARLRAAPTLSASAFGALDGLALVMGRVRGANAQAATVLRVTAVPAVDEIEGAVQAVATTSFDPVADLTEAFYGVLAELHGAVRAWEAKAPAAERMHPRTMARLWQEALDACARRGKRVTDAYGRQLRLSRLPGDLLALVDPRAVVVKGTRLPEDIESWPAWVARERP
jgi:hypothetical protein